MHPKEQIADLPIYQPGKPINDVKREYGLTEVIKLASNENPFGPSPRIGQALQEIVADLAYYPDGAAVQLRQALADYYNMDGSQFIFGNGSDNIIHMITRTYLQSRTNSIMATPSFSEYRISVIIDGGEAIEVPLSNGVHDLVAMQQQINDQTKVVWICNPNNPSGTYNTHQEVIDFLEGVPDDVLVVLDEAYCEYVTAQDFPDGLSLLKQYHNVILLRTFSKIYGLAGLRIGYGLADPQIIAQINKVREPFNASSMAQHAAIVALGDQEYRWECYEKNKQGKKQYYEALDKLGIAYYPSEANFIMVDVNQPADPIFQALLEQGLIVRSGSVLGFPTCLRITIGTQQQNATIITALQNLMK